MVEKRYKGNRRQMKDFEKLIKLARQKHTIDLKRGERKYMDPLWLIENICKETDEVKEEIKADNHAYLEDELSDILWGWLILVEKLQSSGFSGSHQDIIKRALKKYEERILPLNGDRLDNEIWESIKAKQKVALEKEQLRTLGSKRRKE